MEEGEEEGEGKDWWSVWEEEHGGTFDDAEQGPVRSGEDPLRI